MLSALFDISNIAFIVPLSGFGTSTYAVSYVELWSTIFGLASVIGCARNKMWWYPIGIINSIGFIAIFYQINLYSDLLLNFYFIGMSIFGWIMWKKNLSDGSSKFPISWMQLEHRIGAAIVVIAGTYILGCNIDLVFSSMAHSVAYVLSESYSHTPAAMPFWDAFTTVSSMVAMYLLTKRYVEAWVLWVIVDVVCIGLYMYKGVIAMSAEYFVFLINAVVALYVWNKTSKESLC